jgi:hypothetical protein
MTLASMLAGCDGGELGLAGPLAGDVDALARLLNLGAAGVGVSGEAIGAGETEVGAEQGVGHAQAEGGRELLAEHAEGVPRELALPGVDVHDDLPGSTHRKPVARVSTLQSAEVSRQVKLPLSSMVRIESPVVASGAHWRLHVPMRSCSWTPKISSPNRPAGGKGSISSPVLLLDSLPLLVSVSPVVPVVSVVVRCWCRWCRCRSRCRWWLWC